MADKIAFLLLACVLSLTARGADVFRWVDENGKVHYGDAIPEKYKQQAKKVDAAGAGVTGAQRQEAESRSAREKARAEALQKSRESKAPAAKPSAPADTPKAAEGCEERMKKYLESQICFDQYRIANGAVKPEAFQNCPDIPQPVGCTGSPVPSERTYLPRAP